MNKTYRSKKKIYRKKKRSFKLRGGTYLRNTINRKSQVLHPLNAFVKKKLGDLYLVKLDKDNIEQLDYEDIYTKAFFQKYIDILNYSFEKEREYSISKGIYQNGYKHDINSVKSNTHNSKFETLILCSGNLTPISFLYIEKNDDDYDKIWTVCSDPEKRGQGMSSKLLKYMIVKQLNEDRPKMLLEVFNDQVISREDNDVKQSQIMTHFGNNGFENTALEDLDRHTYNNLLSNDGRTKIMIFNPKKWLQDNKEENRNLNSNAKELCNN